MDYQEFLLSKMPPVQEAGFTPKTPVPDWFKPHQRDIVHWAIEKGRAAIFSAFGTGKTVSQLQLMKWVHEHTGGKTLIVAPLGVRQEFTRNDGPRMGLKIQYCRTDEEVAAADTPYIITNYERVRDGGIDPAQFEGASLDEASCLRSYGSLTTQTFSEVFRAVEYRFVATATPSPNEFLEIINYADFLGVMDRGLAMTRFFQRDSKKAGNLQLYPHEEKNFWLWVASWAVFLNSPADLGYDATGYDLPPMEVKWHEVEAPMEAPGSMCDSWGQPLLFEKPNAGIQHVSKQRRRTLEQRVTKAVEIINAGDPEDHWIVWHYLEDERREIQKQLPESVAVFGTQELEQREQIVTDFSNGDIRILSSKPELLGSGCNFQRHCHKAIFIGPTDKFNDFIQAIHRIYRFLQSHPVEIHIVFADSQYDTVVIMRNKWERHNILQKNMQEIIRKHGLSGDALKMKLQRDIHIDRAEVTGTNYRAIRNDCVKELATWEDNCVDEIVTSIPFSTQYEYSPHFADFGHNQGDDGFFEQFDFLVPELYRVLKPGRIACIHTKDRVEYGTMTGNAMYSVNPFSDKTVLAFQKHGWIYMGRIVIDTDVVRENAQTYRLGHTENSKDSTKMGCGSTEFVLIFRKFSPDMSPNQTANGPDPVTKDKSEYTRAKWQIHASGIWRSDGNELVSPQMLKGMETGEIYHWWRNYCQKHAYSYQDHVKFTEAVESVGKLPASMMLLAPCSPNPDVWTDIVRIATLNTELSRKTTESHVCLAEGSLILTKEHGYLPIEHVAVGDNVLTHLGRWRPVMAAKCTAEHAEVIQINAQGVSQLTLTPTHKLWARSSEGKQRKKDAAKLRDPKWVAAKDLDDCYLNHKLPPEEVPDNEDLQFWWIIGRWIADGHWEIRRGGLVISVGNDKVAEFLDKVGDKVGLPAYREGCQQYRLRDPDAKFRNVVQECGSLAANKRLPAIAFTLPLAQATALLDGYLSGDGYYMASRKRWYATSVSKELLLGLKVLIQRVHGDIASLYPGRAARVSEIQGREVNCQQEWNLSWGGTHRSFRWIADDGAWLKMRGIEPAGFAKTYNLHVMEDNSYTAEGCVVKNCPLQTDVVERLIERYSNPGDTILDPFGGIHTVPYVAIGMGRKGIGIELNPDYWKFGVTFCERADQHESAPTLFDLLDDDAVEVVGAS